MAFLPRASPWVSATIIMTSTDKIKMAIIENAEIMAKALTKGKDLEIRKSANGVSVAEVDKKVVIR